MFSFSRRSQLVRLHADLHFPVEQTDDTIHIARCEQLANHHDLAFHKPFRDEVLRALGIAFRHVFAGLFRLVKAHVHFREPEAFHGLERDPERHLVVAQEVLDALTGPRESEVLHVAGHSDEDIAQHERAFHDALDVGALVLPLDTLAGKIHVEIGLAQIGRGLLFALRVGANDEPMLVCARWFHSVPSLCRAFDFHAAPDAGLLDRVKDRCVVAIEVAADLIQ